MNVKTSVREKSDGGGGCGNGDALKTAFSIDRTTAASPLQRPTETPVTSPLGICVTLTTHSRSLPALGGRIQRCSILF
ncbi:MAG: hypothetical protein R3305_04725 [Gammaproteobacteria bacterium]|nr:hypothetical protein [Gammaproteobacteria bacterium]